VELTDAGPAAVLRAAPEAPGACSVVIRPLVAGICRSDVKEVARSRAVRSDFGHEVVGEVVATGTPERLPLGTRVCFDPHPPLRRTSGFAERMFAYGDAETLARAFVRVPDRVAPERMVFCEPLACAHHAVRNLLRHMGRATLEGAEVAVLGAGTAGTLIALLCRRLGARVHLVNRSPRRLRFVVERGVLAEADTRLLAARPERAYEAVVAATAFATPDVLRAAEGMLRPGGTLLVYAGTHAGDRFPGTALDVDRLRREEELAAVRVDGAQLAVGGTYGATGEDFAAASALLAGADRPLELERLVAREIGLAALPALLRRVAAGEEELYGKVLVRLDLREEDVR
jgi:threonine dehydrogenase-like Zn-dependent dehydrogenase